MSDQVVAITSYDVAIKPEPSDAATSPQLFVRSFLRTDTHNRHTLIIAVWNSVEAFEGKILASRIFTATQCLEHWRTITAEDRVSIRSQLTISNLGTKSIGPIQVLSLPGGNSSQAPAVITVARAKGKAIALTAMASPMPTIILVPLIDESAD